MSSDVNIHDLHIQYIDALEHVDESVDEQIHNFQKDKGLDDDEKTRVIKALEKIKHDLFLEVRAVVGRNQ